jgi:hypothetical protein
VSSVILRVEHPALRSSELFRLPSPSGSGAGGTARSEDARNQVYSLPLPYQLAAATPRLNHGLHGICKGSPRA